MELGEGERQLLLQICCQLAFPREEGNLHARRDPNAAAVGLVTATDHAFGTRR